MSDQQIGRVEFGPLGFQTQKSLSMTAKTMELVRAEWEAPLRARIEELEENAKELARAAGQSMLTADDLSARLERAEALLRRWQASMGAHNPRLDLETDAALEKP